MSLVKKIAQTCVRIILIADTGVKNEDLAAGSGAIKDSEYWCQKMTTAGN